MACCDACGTTARALRGDPAARKLLALEGHDSPQLIGGILPDVVYPSDVTKRKARIDPSMVATDAAVKACAAVLPAERLAWDAFYANWRAWFATPEPWFFGAANDWEETKALEAQLAGWQAELRQKCSIPGPVVQDDTILDLSGLKWVAGAGIAIAAAYLLGPIVGRLASKR